jgi:hypothetical protein
MKYLTEEFLRARTLRSSEEPIWRENIWPERAERRARLVNAIARGRRWLDELSSGAVTDAQLWPNASDARCAKLN